MNIYCLLFKNFFILLFLCSCQKESKPSHSAIILALEGLSGSNFSCHPFEDSETSGFQILCKEAIRFTHAFTPSPMSQASIGSILTGVHPLSHNLRDNGLTFLAAKDQILPEVLFHKGVHTLFIASAPTVKRYSRLHQGFENFLDDYDPSFKTFYRPISESLQIIKSWMKTEVKQGSYFAFIHIADLLFPHIITQTELLEPRPKGIEGQLEEVDENLFNLITYLKKAKRWDNSYIVLTGLNGMSANAHPLELPSSNLYLENVSVPLFIKPPKGREEIPHQWKVDTHISLQDLGATLYEIFSASERFHTNETQNSTIKNNLLVGTSFLPLLNGKNNTPFITKPLLIETAWPLWSFNAPVRYSLRDDQWLVIFNKKPVLYNTVSDRNEFNKISKKDGAYDSTVGKFTRLMDFTEILPYEDNQLQLLDSIRFAQIVVENSGPLSVRSFKEISEQLTDSNLSTTQQWLWTDQLINQKNWTQIELSNHFWSNPWITQILSLNKNDLTSDLEFDPCLSLFFNANPEHLSTNNLLNKNCDNKTLVLLSDFLKQAPNKNDLLLEQLAPILRHYELQLKIIYLDLSKGGVILGANYSKLRDLLLFKLILHLPKYQKELQQLEKRI